jgi:carboxymethylenebutenolidase
VPDTTVPGGASAPELRAHLAVPPVSEGPWPGVVVVHEAFGLNDDTRQQADRLAAAGYLALAPDLFSGGGAVRCLRRTFGDLFRQDGPAFGDLEAARSWLAGREDCTGRVGVVGFCMGGGFAVLSAPRFDFGAAAVNYGQVPKDARELLRGSCPIVASYGARDLPLKGAAARLEDALQANGVDHDVKEYPGASHSFLTRYDGVTAAIGRVTGIGLHAPAADDAWRRIDAFFDRHLKGS